MHTITCFKAFDGPVFESEDACKAHEKKNLRKRFVGLTQEQVDAAFAREDIELADAFELAGSRISRVRYDAGEKRWERGPAPETTPPLALTGPRTDAEPDPQSSISTGEPRNNPDDESEAEARAA